LTRYLCYQRKEKHFPSLILSFPIRKVTLDFALHIYILRVKPHVFVFLFLLCSSWLHLPFTADITYHFTLTDTCCCPLFMYTSDTSPLICYSMHMFWMVLARFWIQEQTVLKIWPKSWWSTKE
jgi:hypothetical protein